MTGYVPCPRNCHERCLYNTAASGCPRILYEDRIVVLENMLAEALQVKEQASTCLVCGGSGDRPNQSTTAATKTCPGCGGLGWVRVQQATRAEVTS